MKEKQVLQSGLFDFVKDTGAISNLYGVSYRIYRLRDTDAYLGFRHLKDVSLFDGNGVWIMSAEALESIETEELKHIMGAAGTINYLTTEQVLDKVNLENPEVATKLLFHLNLLN